MGVTRLLEETAIKLNLSQLFTAGWLLSSKPQASSFCHKCTHLHTLDTAGMPISYLNPVSINQHDYSVDSATRYPSKMYKSCNYEWNNCKKLNFYLG